MTESQKEKRKFRQSKEWKTFRGYMKKKAGGLDKITQKPLRKGYQVHHLNLDESQYKNLNEKQFICLNNLSHKFIHWLFPYFTKDPAIIDRIKSILEEMQKTNAE